jgi:methyltransferase (TIGR00027 family)
MKTSILAQNEKTTLALSDVQATALLTLFCRALENESEDPILHDPKAREIANQIKPVLAQSPDALYQSLAQGRVNKVLQTHIAMRAWKYDQVTQQFLRRCPMGGVVNLGCGMDTRFWRVDNGTVQFFDLDLPELIAFKRQLVDESERYQMIAASVFDTNWMERVAQTGVQDWLFLAEGLFMYLDENKLREMVLTLQARFPGAELLCEVVNRLYLNKFFMPMVKRKMQRSAHLGKDATFRFGVGDSRELEEWNHGIQFLDDWNYLDTRHPRLGWVRLLSGWEFFRKTQWTVHYRLN